MRKKNKNKMCYFFTLLNKLPTKLPTTALPNKLPTTAHADHKLLVSPTSPRAPWLDVLCGHPRSTATRCHWYLRYVVV